MAEEKYTIFQRLQKVLSSGNVQRNYMTNDYGIISPKSDVIVYITITVQKSYLLVPLNVLFCFLLTKVRMFIN